MSQAKYPHIQVTLSGTSGNALSLVGAVERGLRRADVDPAEIQQFRKEALSGDYDHVIQTAMRWVDVD